MSPVTPSRLIPGCLAAVLVVSGTAVLLGQSGEHRFEVREEAGIPTAVSSGGPRFEGELFTYEHVLTLVQDPGVTESLISRAVGFAGTADGHYVVVDNRSSRGTYTVARLVIFGPDGRFIRSIGQVGSGPGDFQGMLLEEVREDVVTIYDIRLRRLTRYRTDGELLGTFTAPPAFPRLSRQLYRTPDDRYVALQIQDLNVKATYIEYWIVDAEGGEIAHHRTPEVTNSIQVDTGGGLIGPYQYPYPPIAAVRYLAGSGIAVSAGSEPVIEVFDLEGQLARCIQVEDLPLEITREDIERFDSFWESRLEEIPEAARPDMRRLRSSLREAMPDARPPWTNMAVDDRGFWWLRVQNDPDVWMSGERPYVYRLLSPEGEYLGVTTAPPTFIRNSALHSTYPVSVCNGQFLTMQSDPETGENLLKVYRMEPACEGFRYR